MAWFYIITGYCLVMYPMTLVVRVRQWEIKQKQSGKSIRNAFIILPVAMIGFFLGIFMAVFGSEILKGNY